MSDASDYPRDMIGYGRTPPNPQWPGGARVAVQFVVNYEEGGENNVLHGDAAAEAFLSEIPGAQPIAGARHMNMESIYEYGSRVGVWRLLRLFEERGLHFTAFAVASALERHPDVARAMAAGGHEIASHGLRWIDYQHVAADVERAHIAEAVRVHTEVTGERPLGFYQGRSSPNTERLCVEEGGFLYHADSYADELPYYTYDHGRPQLVVPYTLDANDMRFSTAAGFGYGEDFFAYLRDTFDQLYEEGASSPRMMSVGLHCRLAGRPGRARNLARFLDHVQSRPEVWVARRVDIARHWLATHPPEAGRAARRAATPAQKVEKHHGGCHCGAIRFTAELDLTQPVVACNCSMCRRRGSLLAFVPDDAFVLEQGGGELTEYRFNTLKIEHLFCHHCGIAAFSRGPGPHGPMVAVNVRTVDDVDVSKLNVTEYDGADK